MEQVENALAFLVKCEPYFRVLRKIGLYCSIISVPLGPLLACFVNVTSPGILAKAHVSFAYESIALAWAFWALIVATSVFLSANSWALGMSIPKRFVGASARWESGRGALSLSLLFSSILGLGAAVAWVGIWHAQVTKEATLWGFAGWLLVNTVAGTTAFIVSRRSARGAGTFAWRAFVAVVGYASSVCNIVIIVASLWAAHRTNYPQYEITPFFVTVLFLIFLTIIHVSAAHRRVSGVLFGTGLTLLILATFSPSSFAFLLARLAGLQ